MKVLANADSGPDALQAAGNGAMGIGLCRTEHMFFCLERLPIVRRWIFHTECLDDLEHIKHFQRSDFKDLFAGCLTRGTALGVGLCFTYYYSNNTGER